MMKNKVHNFLFCGCTGCSFPPCILGNGALKLLEKLNLELDVYGSVETLNWHFLLLTAHKQYNVVSECPNVSN